MDEYVINARKQKPRKKRPAVPWRQLAPGKSSGLTFAIKEELEDKACVHSDDTGFMINMYIQHANIIRIIEAIVSLFIVGGK